jgi:hypothetical protein
MLMHGGSIIVDNPRWKTLVMAQVAQFRYDGKASNDEDSRDLVS